MFQRSLQLLAGEKCRKPETFEFLPRFIFPRFSLLLSADTRGKILVKKKKKEEKKKKKESTDSIFKLANDDMFFRCLSNFLIII